MRLGAKRLTGVAVVLAVVVAGWCTVYAQEGTEPAKPARDGPPGLPGLGAPDSMRPHYEGDREC
jgi:hypothetical protein